MSGVLHDVVPGSRMWSAFIDVSIIGVQLHGIRLFREVRLRADDQLLHVEPLTWVERHFGDGIARAYTEHTDSTGQPPPHTSTPTSKNPPPPSPPWPANPAPSPSP